MPLVLVCTACLASGVRMCSLSASGLQRPYQLLSGIQQTIDNLQEMVCWECAALIHKFIKFRRKCEMAHVLLQDVVLLQYEETKLSSVLEQKRKLHNLCSAYSVFSTATISIKPDKAKLKQRASIHKTMPIKPKVEGFEREDEVWIPLECEKKTFLENEDIKECEIIMYEPTTESITEAIKEECSENNDSVKTDIKNEICNAEISESKYTKDWPAHSESMKNESRRKIQRKIKPKSAKVGKTKVQKSTKDLELDSRMFVEMLTQEQQYETILERQTKADISPHALHFFCRLCCTTFMNERSFNNHKLLHDPESGEMECDICHIRFVTRRQLARHVLAQHTKRYTCRACNKKFYTRNKASKHITYHKGQSVKCYRCGETFEKKNQLYKHMKEAHDSIYTCGECGETFVSVKGLKHHCKIKHCHKDDGRRPRCELCAVQFTSQQAYRRHLKLSLRHADERLGASFECGFCRERFPDADSMKQHESKHTRPPDSATGDEDITCEQCGEPQVDGRAYHAHFRREHPGETRTHHPNMKAPLMCEQCGKVFQTTFTLKVHTYTHTGERPCKCTVCGKGFKLTESLKVHMRIHTKDRPHRCNICNMGFTNPSNLLRHKKVHSDDKRFPCEICKKTFKCSSTVKTHIEFVHLKRPWPKRDRSKRAKTTADISDEHNINHLNP